MCIIITKPVGVELPLPEVLEHCASVNRDGIGLAFTQAEMIKIKKDFKTVEELQAYIKTNVSRDHAAIFHFRIGTAGLKDEGNCHPFPVTRRRKRLRAVEVYTDLALAHNGTFTDFKDDKKYSDTLLFVRGILADPIIRNNLASEAVQELIKAYISTSRLAIMNRQGEIMKFGRFEEKWGLSFSNSNFEPTSFSYIPPSRYGGHENSAVTEAIDRFNCSRGRNWKSKEEQCFVCYKFFNRHRMNASYKGSPMWPTYFCDKCWKIKEREEAEATRLAINNQLGEDNAN